MRICFHAFLHFFTLIISLMMAEWMKEVEDSWLTMFSSTDIIEFAFHLEYFHNIIIFIILFIIMILQHFHYCHTFSDTPSLFSRRWDIYFSRFIFSSDDAVSYFLYKILKLETPLFRLLAVIFSLYSSSFSAITDATKHFTPIYFLSLFSPPEIFIRLSSRPPFGLSIITHILIYIRHYRHDIFWFTYIIIYEFLHHASHTHTASFSH